MIVPILKTGADNEAILKRAKETYKDLGKAGVRAHLDDRPNYNPGWKYNHYELKGVPIRLEIGNSRLYSVSTRTSALLSLSLSCAQKIITFQGVRWDPRILRRARDPLNLKHILCDQALLIPPPVRASVVHFR